MASKKYYLYVLVCGDGSFYGGFTDNVEHRLYQHQSGKGAKYTKSHAPVRLLYYEDFDNKSDALKAEYAFKHQTRFAKEQYLINHGVDPILWIN